jgi:phosphate transport system substrate-binding protein
MSGNGAVKGWLASLVLTMTVGCTSGTQLNRVQVYILASPTTYSMAQVVSERLITSNASSVAKISETNLSEGIKLFCESTGDGNPNVLMTSQLIEKADRDVCRSNGIENVLELKIGYEGIAITSAIDAPGIAFSRNGLFLAVAGDKARESEGEKNGKRYIQWSDVNRELPPIPIQMMAPGKLSGTWSMFVELAMEVGCESIPWIAKLKNADPSLYDTTCNSTRDDGVLMEMDEYTMSIIETLESNSMTFAILDYSFLERYADRLMGSRVDGVFPTSETIASGEYPLARAIYLYVKSDELKSESKLKAYLNELVSDLAMGKDGYLKEYGLVPVSQDQRKKAEELIQSM